MQKHAMMDTSAVATRIPPNVTGMGAGSCECWADEERPAEAHEFREGVSSMDTRSHAFVRISRELTIESTRAKVHCAGAQGLTAHILRIFHLDVPRWFRDRLDRQINEGRHDIGIFRLAGGICGQ